MADDLFLGGELILDVLLDRRLVVHVAGDSDMRSVLTVDLVKNMRVELAAARRIGRGEFAMIDDSDGHLPKNPCEVDPGLTLRRRLALYPSLFVLQLVEVAAGVFLEHALELADARMQMQQHSQHCKD